MPQVRSRPKLVALFIGVLALGTACIPQFGTDSGPLTHGVLTPDSADTYQFSTNGSIVTVRAPSWNQGGNLREFFWDKNSPFYADQESCNRWDTIMDLSTPEKAAGMTRADIWQPGAGLRIAPTPDGEGLRGISVDMNVWGNVWSTLWVLIWDSTKTHPFTGVASFDISGIVGPSDDLYAPPPWNVCGQAFGDTVRVKFWVGEGPEPSWNDPKHVFIATLPPGWDYAGYPGGYVAHIDPGVTQQFTNLRTGVLMPDGSQPPPPSTSSVPPSSTSIPPTTPASSTSAPSTTAPGTPTSSTTAATTSVPVSTTVAVP